MPAAQPKSFELGGFAPKPHQGLAPLDPHDSSPQARFNIQRNTLRYCAQLHLTELECLQSVLEE